jgi:hypothetical protein
MKYGDLNNESLIHATIDNDHYDNDFVRKFLDQKFADDYDIGKSSIYRSQEDIDRDTIKIINGMKAYDENPNTDRDSDEYTERMKYYEDMIKNSPKSTSNYDCKGWQN